ncbi:fungal specific transcription factor domain-containing protein [Aspergillus ibericus CBS 121593]|uniref:Transcription factor domain-containing protein n=1 Tax=Aspergillus ibericus CBS 121593 TaxID=1448316 RepID=A0A395GI38_9EURO|nr:hypothetical protein BO80DRAFT_279826 [Aspergillus ibericus CBS 121593]RAK95080.1 hypothetical protein BO80DRAFT_279826 [Aspergillus ibericus CBS 121593]
MEARHEAQMQQMQNTLAQLAALQPVPQPTVTQSEPLCAGDIVARGIVSESEWEELYDFFYENCRTVVGFMDDQIYHPKGLVRQHPLMSTVICAVAARAIKPEKYQSYLAEADELVKNTFVGPSPDIQAVRAMMLLGALAGRSRLWGYVASLAAELGLNTAALKLGEDDTEHTFSLVERARTWFTLCCFDLTMHLNRPFVINRMREYLPFAKKLLASPYCRPVDHRICAYIVGFTTPADAKTRLTKAQLQLNPLGAAQTDLLTSFDRSIDEWFYRINNIIEPQYQTFSDKQDRNRFIIPYTFMKMYINGFALHGLEPAERPDPNRLVFIQKALKHATLLIRSQFESDKIRRQFQYTIDYHGSSTYQAISFILKAIPATHQYLQCGDSIRALHQAAQMFQEAGATEAARDIQREQKKMALLTQTVVSPSGAAVDLATADGGRNTDIPTSLDTATWYEPFPMLGLFALD